MIAAVRVPPSASAVGNGAAPPSAPAAPFRDLEGFDAWMLRFLSGVRPDAAAHPWIVPAAPPRLAG